MPNIENLNDALVLLEAVVIKGCWMLKESAATMRSHMVPTIRQCADYRGPLIIWSPSARNDEGS